MEVYINDILVKSIKAADHIIDLREAFDALRRHHMRLNPTKYAFEVSSRKFLDFLITNQGIQANPEKIKAIIEMQHPTIKKDTTTKQPYGNGFYSSGLKIAAIESMAVIQGN